MQTYSYGLVLVILATVILIGFYFVYMQFRKINTKISQLSNTNTNKESKCNYTNGEQKDSKLTGDNREITHLQNEYKKYKNNLDINSVQSNNKMLSNDIYNTQNVKDGVDMTGNEDNENCIDNNSLSSNSINSDMNVDGISINDDNYINSDEMIAKNDMDQIMDLKKLTENDDSEVDNDDAGNENDGVYIEDEGDDDDDNYDENYGNDDDGDDNYDENYGDDDDDDHNENDDDDDHNENDDDDDDDDELDSNYSEFKSLSKDKQVQLEEIRKMTVKQLKLNIAKMGQIVKSKMKKKDLIKIYTELTIN